MNHPLDPFVFDPMVMSTHFSSTSTVAEAFVDRYRLVVGKYLERPLPGIVKNLKPIMCFNQNMMAGSKLVPLSARHTPNNILPPIWKV